MSYTVFPRHFLRTAIRITDGNLHTVDKLCGRWKLGFSPSLSRLLRVSSTHSATTDQQCSTCVTSPPRGFCRPHNLWVLPQRRASDFAGAPPSHDEESTLTEAEYEDVCEETLQSLADRFEDLAESDLGGEDFDVQYASGVLTFKMGAYGTYVINKQTPNKQIWLSSPESGPKRYDYRDETWIYKHDGVSLHTMLSQELSGALGQIIDLTNCSYAKRGNT